MPKNVAIVESPAKAKTIGQYLGSDFVVESSYGHIRDLVKKNMGIDIKNGFAPTYEIPADKKKLIANLRKIVKDAEQVWLATDEDREGEAIAWHLAEALKLDAAKAKRIVFHEITESAIKTAIAQPRTIDQDRVNAQQARRVLDRLVGYELSPILWRKVRTGLSAGRVQSVAVRLIVEREREIRNFKPESSFKAVAELLAGSASFEAELNKRLADGAAARQFLETAKASEFKVGDVTAKTASRSPAPPFTTSSLQQAASSSLGFSVRRTMVLAQKLYEAGLITYMRTDSVALAEQALTAAGRYIEETYGTDYHHRRSFKTKSKLAQEAHEAIRPTDFNRSEAGSDQGAKKLYGLIWARALASQMAPARLARTSVAIDISGSEFQLKAEGEVVEFPGFLKVYKDKAARERLLPKLEVGQKLELKQLVATETLSKPKARYSEASLVRQLESLGIGRPSTYAPTISTIQYRGYVEKTPLEGEPRNVRVLTLKADAIAETEIEIRVGSAKNKLLPTEIAEAVNDLLVKYMGDVLDYDFTAQVEAQFDLVAQGQLAWPEMIAAFYKPFHTDVVKMEGVSRQEAMQVRSLGTDPTSGRPMFARIARYGPIIQVGKTEDDEKPRFAPIPKNLRFDAITREQALELLKLPRLVGKTEAGEEIYAQLGRFGPYLKAGSLSVALKDEDPLTVSLETALTLIAAKQKQEAEKLIRDFPEAKVQILNGPYGPYVTDSKERRRVPKDVDPTKLTLTEVEELLKQPKGRRPRGN